MNFSWPVLLLPLFLLPLLVVTYGWVLRRRRRTAVTYSSVALIKAARPRRSSRRQHLPFAALLMALACLALAGARPQWRMDIPVEQSAVILAVDVSQSMCATDVAPNRLLAAQAAVRGFVTSQGPATRMGLIVFSDYAQLTVAPTTDRKELLGAIDALTTGGSTTIGSAILKSVDAIAQIDPAVQPSPDLPDDDHSSPPGGPPDPAPGNGPYASEIVVLLTDGANTDGVSPRVAAKIAAARGVRVFPIGFGTTNLTTMSCTPQQLGRPRPGNEAPQPAVATVGNGGGRIVMAVDEATLRDVAHATGGTYFGATDAAKLQDVFTDLPRHVAIQQRDVEVTVALLAMGAVLILLAAWAAVRWGSFPS